MNQTPWVEKYRPTDFDKIILDPLNENIFRNILDTNNFPNLLFYGPPGTGKTTSIINIINNYQERNDQVDSSLIMHLNASDDRGIDIIRNQIQPFVKTANFFKKGTKFVILDEVDYMTKNAQQALKYLLQTCDNDVRFCLICNYISKVDDSLQNEFITIRFNQLPQEKILSFIENIIENEKLTISESSIKRILKNYGSDIRSIVNFIQLNQNSFYENENIINNDVYDVLYNNLINNEFNDIKMYINNKTIQYNIDKHNFIIDFFNYIFLYKKHTINSKIMNLCKQICHNNVDNEYIINYFISEMKKIIPSNP